MGTCRCEVLNVMSGEVAADYARTHLHQVRNPGDGHAHYRCPETGIAWMEDRKREGHGDEIVVLRRSQR